MFFWLFRLPEDGLEHGLKHLLVAGRWPWARFRHLPAAGRWLWTQFKHPPAAGRFVFGMVLASSGGRKMALGAV